MRLSFITNGFSLVSLNIPVGIVTIHIKPGKCRCAVR